jgi:hypothetical protein
LEFLVGYCAAPVAGCLLAIPGNCGRKGGKIDNRPGRARAVSSELPSGEHMETNRILSICGRIDLVREQEV